MTGGGLEPTQLHESLFLLSSIDQLVGGGVGLDGGHHGSCDECPIYTRGDANDEGARALDSGSGRPGLCCVRRIRVVTCLQED